MAQYNMTQFLVTVIGARSFNEREMDEIATSIQSMVRDKDRQGGLMSKPDYSIHDVTVHNAGSIIIGTGSED